MTLFPTLPHVPMVLMIGMIMTTTAFFSPPPQAATKVKLAVGTSPLESEIQNFADKKAPALIDFITDEANLDSLSTKSWGKFDIMRDSVSRVSTNVNAMTERNLSTMKDSVKGMNSQVSPILSDANSQLSEASKNIHDAKESLSVMKESLLKSAVSVAPALNNAGGNIENSVRLHISQLKASIDGLADLSGRFNGIEDKLSELKVLSGGPVNFDSLLDKFHISEYGPLYIAAAVVFVTVQHQMESEGKKVPEVFAAKDPTHAKDMKKNIDAGAMRKVTVLEAEKTMMETEISKLKEESVELKRVIKTVAYKMKTKPSKLQEDVIAVEKPSKNLNTGASRKVKELQAEKMMMEATISKLKEEVTGFDALVSSIISSKKSQVFWTNKNVEKSLSTVSTKEAVTEEVTMLPPQPKAETISEPSKEAVELLQTEIKNALSTATTKDAVTEEINNDNPWGMLKDSTLKKKKKSELIEYLAERNVEYVPGMVKAELINIIKNESSWMKLEKIEQ